MLPLSSCVSGHDEPRESRIRNDRTKTKTADSAASLGFEAKLWLAADKLRNNMDAAEYKHVVLGLIFLKYISDAFEEMRARLLEGKGEFKGANPEDPDEYRAENVFWVPPAARWSYLQGSAKQPAIGKTVDDAKTAIERDNPRLKGVLPKDYRTQERDDRLEPQGERQGQDPGDGQGGFCGSSATRRTCRKRRSGPCWPRPNSCARTGKGERYQRRIYCFTGKVYVKTL